MRAFILIVAPILAGLGIGCGGTTNQPIATEEQQKDPAWFQAQLKEMDKNLMPEKKSAPGK